MYSASVSEDGIGYLTPTYVLKTGISIRRDVDLVHVFDILGKLIETFNLQDIAEYTGSLLGVSYSDGSLHVKYVDESGNSVKQNFQVLSN